MIRTPPQNTGKDAELASKVCGVCCDKLSPRRSYPSCKECKKIYHFKCLKDCPSVRTWSRYTPADQNQWLCEFCALLLTRNRKRQRTPELDLSSKRISSSENCSRNLFDTSTSERLSQQNQEMGTLTLDSIKTLMEEQFASFKTSVLDEIQNKIEDTLRNEIGMMKEENQHLQNRVLELEERVAELEKCEETVLELNQYSRRNDLIIDGFTETRGEYPLDAVLRFGRQVGYELKKEQIDDCHRLPRKKNALPQSPRPFIIRFVNRHVKRELLIRLKVNKPNGIYANDHLTYHTTQIKLEARRMLKPKGFFIESRDCSIIARRGEEKYKLRSVQQVYQLLNKISVNNQPQVETEGSVPMTGAR